MQVLPNLWLPTLQSSEIVRKRHSSAERTRCRTWARIPLSNYGHAVRTAPPTHVLAVSLPGMNPMQGITVSRRCSTYRQVCDMEATSPISVRSCFGPQTSDDSAQTLTNRQGYPQQYDTAQNWKLTRWATKILNSLKPSYAYATNQEYSWKNNYKAVQTWVRIPTICPRFSCRTRSCHKMSKIWLRLYV